MNSIIISVSHNWKYSRRQSQREREIPYKRERKRESKRASQRKGSSYSQTIVGRNNRSVLAKPSSVPISGHAKSYLRQIKKKISTRTSNAFKEARHQTACSGSSAVVISMSATQKLEDLRRISGGIAFTTGRRIRHYQNIPKYLS